MLLGLLRIFVITRQELGDGLVAVAAQVLVPVVRTLQIKIALMIYFWRVANLLTFILLVELKVDLLPDIDSILLIEFIKLPQARRIHRGVGLKLGNLVNGLNC